MLNLINDSGLSLAMLVLPLTILANNFLGAAQAGLLTHEGFKKTKLKKGLAKGALVYTGILIYAGVSFLMDDLTISIMNGEYTLVDAMYVIVLATIVKYSTDGIKKLMTIMRYEDLNEDEDEGYEERLIGFNQDVNDKEEDKYE